jgi:hypothetical protein
MGDLSHHTPYWDSVACDRTFTIPVDTARLKELVLPEQHILDYGCGYGRKRQLEKGV